MKVVLYSARYPSVPVRLAPLGLGYIASYLIYSGILEKEDVSIVDSFEEAMALDPDVIGVSSTSQVIDDARLFASRCKRNNPECITVLGGYHITLLPEKLPEEYDLGVLGEGEHTFAELISAIITHKRTDIDILRTINGLCYREDHKIFLTSPRKLISDLDTLPFPMRHRKYSNESPIFTSRGCPYACTYCAGPVFWGGSYRLRSAESVVNEIQTILSSENPDEIAILDDLWMANKRRFKNIVELLEADGIPDKVRFRGFCRSNLIYEDDILLFKRMNYRLVRFGAETGSETLLRKIKGKQASVVHHQRTIDLCHKHGLPCAGSFIFGIPGETENDLRATVNFLRKNRGKLKISGFYFFNPIPATSLWCKLLSQGEIQSDFTPETMTLDLTNPSFDWTTAKYFNQHNIPLDTLIFYVAIIQKEFLS